MGLFLQWCSISLRVYHGTTYSSLPLASCFLFCPQWSHIPPCCIETGRHDLALGPLHLLSPLTSLFLTHIPSYNSSTSFTFLIKIILETLLTYFLFHSPNPSYPDHFCFFSIADSPILDDLLTDYTYYLLSVSSHQNICSTGVEIFALFMDEHQASREHTMTNVYILKFIGKFNKFLKFNKVL